MKRGKSRKGLRIFLFIIILLVIIAGLFLAVKGYISWRGKRNEMIFQQGIQFGYTEAVLQIMNMSLSCQPVPLFAGNTTIEMIAVDCLS